MEMRILLGIKSEVAMVLSGKELVYILSIPWDFVEDWVEGVPLSLFLLEEKICSNNFIQLEVCIFNEYF
jgi:hypothetical protein